MIPWATLPVCSGAVMHLHKSYAGRRKSHTGADGQRSWSTWSPRHAQRVDRLHQVSPGDRKVSRNSLLYLSLVHHDEITCVQRKFCPSHRTRPTHVASTAATNIGGFWQRLAAEGVLNARGRLSELLRRRGRATISRRHRRPWRRAHTRRRNGTLPSLPSCLERGSLRRENRTKRKTET